MAIQLQNDITTPTRSEWLAQTAINAVDLGDAVEPAQQAYARRGVAAYHLAGPWETASGAWETENGLDGPHLHELLPGAITRRPDADGDFRLALHWWGFGESVRMTITRIDPDGTRTQIAQGLFVSADTTLTANALGVTLPAKNTREGGLVGGAQAPLTCEIEAVYDSTTGAGAAHLEAICLRASELTASTIP